jgi:hypothetical protein
MPTHPAYPCGSGHHGHSRTRIHIPRRWVPRWSARCLPARWLLGLWRQGSARTGHSCPGCAAIGQIGGSGRGVLGRTAGGRRPAPATPRPWYRRSARSWPGPTGGGLVVHHRPAGRHRCSSGSGRCSILSRLRLHHQAEPVSCPAPLSSGRCGRYATGPAATHPCGSVAARPGRGVVLPAHQFGTRTGDTPTCVRWSRAHDGRRADDRPALHLLWTRCSHRPRELKRGGGLRGTQLAPDRRHIALPSSLRPVGISYG